MSCQQSVWWSINLLKCYSISFSSSCREDYNEVRLGKKNDEWICYGRINTIFAKRCYKSVTEPSQYNFFHKASATLNTWRMHIIRGSYVGKCWNFMSIQVCKVDNIKIARILLQRILQQWMTRHQNDRWNKILINAKICTSMGKNIYHTQWMIQN